MSSDQSESRTFVSRNGRLVAFAMAATFFVSMCVIATFAPDYKPGSRGGWRMLDRLSLAAFGLLVGLFLMQFGLVRATVESDGLVVRNLFRRRRVAWAEILRVQYGPHHPWALLELADTEHLPVMAIQRADGERGLAEARRLARLVAERSVAPEPGR